MRSLGLSVKTMLNDSNDVVLFSRNADARIKVLMETLREEEILIVVIIKD